MFSACAERVCWWGSFSAWPDYVQRPRWTRAWGWFVQRLTWPCSAPTLNARAGGARSAPDLNIFSAHAERESWWGSFSAWPDHVQRPRWTRELVGVVQRL